MVFVTGSCSGSRTVTSNVSPAVRCVSSMCKSIFGLFISSPFTEQSILPADRILTAGTQTITAHASSKPTAMAASLPYHLTTPTPSRRSRPFSEAVSITLTTSMYSGYLLYSTVRSQRPFFVAKVIHGSFPSIHTVAYLHVLHTAFSASYHKFAKSEAAGITCSTRFV